MRRTLVIFFVGLFVLAALVFVFFALLGEREEQSPTENEKSGVSSEQGRDPGAAEDGEERDAPVDKAGRKKLKKRLENKKHRQELIASIRAARELRERLGRNEPSSGSAGESGDDEEGEEGTLSKETIQDAVKAVIEDVKICYEDQLDITPDLGGKLVIDFTIEAEEGVGGVVSEVDLGDASDDKMRQNNGLTECITDTIYTLELPEPEGGGKVKVSYPFKMNPS